MANVINIGAGGDVARRNIARIRAGQRLSHADLSQLTADAGRRLPPLSLIRIEQGRRRLDVDDLLVLAVALGVSVVDLLIPGAWPDDAGWQVTAAVVMPVGRGRAWIGGGATARPVTSQADLAEAIRWMPRQRARETAQAWVAANQQHRR